MSFEPVTIPLKSPLLHGDEEIRELVISREMEANDLRGISVNDLKHDEVCVVTARLTGIPYPVLKKMKIPDYLEVAEVIGGFLSGSRPTGGKE